MYILFWSVKTENKTFTSVGEQVKKYVLVCKSTKQNIYLCLRANEKYILAPEYTQKKSLWELKIYSTPSTNKTLLFVGEQFFSFVVKISGT